MIAGHNSFVMAVHQIKVLGKAEIAKGWKPIDIAVLVISRDF